jgi:hypothetical protein
MGYEIDFLPVGDSNGDAICIRYGTPQTGYTIHVVDGGFTDTAETVIDHIETYYGKGVTINHTQGRSEQCGTKWCEIDDFATI